MRLTRLVASAAMLVATVAAAIALGGSSAAAQDSGNDVLRIGWSQDPKTLNPFTGVNEEEYTIWALNWELLLDFDPETLTPSPAIAESWEVSEDRKTVTFDLIRGREVVRRQADHLRRRQVVARRAGLERPAVQRLHRQRHRDQDA